MSHTSAPLPHDPLRVPLERLATTWLVEPGEYLISGCFTRATQTRSWTSRGPQRSDEKVDSSTTRGLAHLRLRLAAARSGPLSAEVNGHTIVLRHPSPGLLSGAFEDPEVSIRLELYSEPEDVLIRYFKSTRQDSETIKRYNYSNPFTGRSWHQDEGLCRQVTQELCFSGRARVDGLFRATHLPSALGDDSTLRLRLSNSGRGAHPMSDSADYAAGGMLGLPPLS